MFTRYLIINMHEDKTSAVFCYLLNVGNQCTVFFLTVDPDFFFHLLIMLPVLKDCNIFKSDREIFHFVFISTFVFIRSSTNVKMEK